MIDRKKLILRNQSDFNRVYRRGNSKGSKYVVVLYLRNRLDYTRVGFVASKKVGNSVERNKARRLMRESYRFLNEDVASGYDVVFVARNTIQSAGKEEVQKVMNKTLSKCSLIKEN